MCLFQDLLNKAKLNEYVEDDSFQGLSYIEQNDFTQYVTNNERLTEFNANRICLLGLQKGMSPEEIAKTADVPLLEVYPRSKVGTYKGYLNEILNEIRGYKNNG